MLQMMPGLGIGLYVVCPNSVGVRLHTLNATLLVQAVVPTQSVGVI